jgi:TRAP-type mannitol/chloroaromatic compound transport system substrate-binding protein
VQLLPGGEIFPALERGVIDAAEFVGPFQDRRMGLQNAAKHYYTTGWHEPQNTGELLINLEAWNSLPDDLKEIVRMAAQATVLESHAWSESVNGEALTDLVENQGVIADPLPESIVSSLREITMDTLETKAAEDETTKKVHDAFFAFKSDFERWAGISEAVYHAQVI